MKTLFVPLLLLACAATGLSQTQETKLVDRIMKPDLTLGNPLQTKKFSDPGSATLGKTSASAREYPGIRQVETKDFAFTRSFLGIKNPWFGGKVYDTKGALVGQYDLKEMDRKLSEKKADAPVYYDATKSANFGSPVVPSKTFVPQPAAQGALSGITDKINNKMTIDEVRELLNKPR